MKTMRTIVAAAALVAGVPLFAADAETPEAEALRLAAQHAHRVDVDEPAEEDPVVFTEITPYTTDEAPVKLPDDQALQ